MPEFKYSPTGDDFLDGYLNAFTGNDSDDPRWQFNIGEIVVVTESINGNSNRKGSVCEVRWRRNAYPPPYFQGCWLPLLYLEPIDGLPGGGEISQECVRKVTEQEVIEARKK